MVARFGHDRSGVAFIIFALMAGVLIPVAGGALDYSRALTVRERLAAAADAAALAISRQQAESEQAKETALAILNANYPVATRKSDSLKKSDAPKESTSSSVANANAVRTANGRVTGDVTLSTANDRVTVQFSANVEALFLPIIGIGSLPATARAVAETSTLTASCIYMRSFYLRGSLTIDGRCPFHIANGKSNRGTSNFAFEQNGSFTNRGKVTVEGLYSRIGAYDNNPPPGQKDSGELKQSQPEANVSDPFKDNVPQELRTLPGSKCTGIDTDTDTGTDVGADTDEKPSKQVKVSKGTSKSLGPGTYCNSWELSGGTLKLAAGVYVLWKPINVSDAAKISGTGVTLIFHEDARFNINTVGRGTGLDFFASAPTENTNPYKGVLIYQTKSAAKDDNCVFDEEETKNCDRGINLVKGSLDFSENFSGIVYTPGMDYDISGAFAFKSWPNGNAVFVARDVYAPLDAATNSIGASFHFAVPKASARIVENSSGPRRSVLVE